MEKQTAYLQTKVETASPSQLILILYDELIKTLIQAGDCIKEKRYEPSHLKLIKAQNIVSELTSSINKDAGPIASNLLSLYQFIVDELIQANVLKDEKRLAPVLDIVGNLRKAWWTGVIMASGK
ncbi:MAG: flagellar export chaperone FliS [Elusimicrobiota bacterium]